MPRRKEKTKKKVRRFLFYLHSNCNVVRIRYELYCTPAYIPPPLLHFYYRSQLPPLLLIFPPTLPPSIPLSLSLFSLPHSILHFFHPYPQPLLPNHHTSPLLSSSHHPFPHYPHTLSHHHTTPISPHSTPSPHPNTTQHLPGKKQRDEIRTLENQLLEARRREVDNSLLLARQASVLEEKLGNSYTECQICLLCVLYDMMRQEYLRLVIDPKLVYAE